jgi:hypothetical protein
MLEHNKRVVLAYTKRLRDLDRQINARVNELEELAAEKRALETGEPPCVEPEAPEPAPAEDVPFINGRALEE